MSNVLKRRIKEIEDSSKEYDNNIIVAKGYTINNSIENYEEWTYKDLFVLGSLGMNFEITEQLKSLDYLMSIIYKTM